MIPDRKPHALNMTPHGWIVDIIQVRVEVDGRSVVCRVPCRAARVASTWLKVSPPVPIGGAVLCAVELLQVRIGTPTLEDVFSRLSIGNHISSWHFVSEKCPVPSCNKY